MLTEVQIENYRALRSLSVPLAPLTVLVGPNDSGKTSFLTALRRMIEGDRNYSDRDYWRCDYDNAIKIQVKIGSDEITMTTSGQVLYRNEGSSSFASSGFLLNQDREPFPITQFQLPVQGPAMYSEGYSDTQEIQPLGADGSGVPSYLDYLLRRDRKRFFAIVEEMKQRIPGWGDVEIATPNPSLRRLEFQIENGLRIWADDASAGVRLMLFFISLAYHPRPPRLILIEEPETGVHPRRIAEIVSLLRKVTQGEFGGYAAQVILTTHSPYLLDCVNLDTDQVLVFRREEDGSRTASPVDAEGLSDFLHDFQLGEVWYNEGEAGLVARP